MADFIDEVMTTKMVNNNNDLDNLIPPFTPTPLSLPDGWNTVSNIHHT